MLKKEFLNQQKELLKSESIEIKELKYKMKNNQRNKIYDSQVTFDYYSHVSLNHMRNVVYNLVKNYYFDAMRNNNLKQLDKFKKEYYFYNNMLASNFIDKTLKYDKEKNLFSIEFTDVKLDFLRDCVILKSGRVIY